jgi:hypothetical protein
MEPRRLSRRRFVHLGISAAAAAAVFDRAPTASAAPPSGEHVVAGHFITAEAPHIAVISLVDSPRNMRVTLDTTAFVAHGADGVVDSLDLFVPGEEIVASGDLFADGLLALDFQSIYTATTGIIERNGQGYVLVTASGQHIDVPQRVAHLHVPSGIRIGAAYGATVWTHPKTGEATALEIVERT